ncbi:MAG TPA: hypothetical protein VE092_08460 [Herbaspirillum sp.]|uniref:hypothetical protein n=1 Tax=Herbaspirillum sp. TaxID=1890675 RepID=UPI002D349E3F|nr:hypothetical protein [Herbaspirillum sp.]HZG20033.1 hypothetical protein [Herbaspirillum sp.]
MAPKQQSERMPANGASRLVNFRLTEAEFAEADLLAKQTYRSRAYFMRIMYLRGLRSYQREHQPE